MWLWPVVNVNITFLLFVCHRPKARTTSSCSLSSHTLSLSITPWRSAVPRPRCPLALPCRAWPSSASTTLTPNTPSQRRKYAAPLGRWELFIRGLFGREHRYRMFPIEIYCVEQIWLPVMIELGIVSDPFIYIFICNVVERSTLTGHTPDVHSL